MTRIALLAALALAAAPVAAQSDEEPPLPLSAFVDSAALHQALRAAPPAPADFKRKLILTVTLDTLGGTPAVEVVGKRYVPPAYADTMAALMRAHLRPQGRIAEARMERVWLRSGSEPYVGLVAGVIEVRPMISNRSAVMVEMDRAVVAILARRPDLAGRTSRVFLRMRINEEGVPEHVEVTRGSDLLAIGEAGRVAQRMRFRPAQLDGYPVSVLVELPLEFKFPEPAVPGAGGARRP